MSAGAGRSRLAILFGLASAACGGSVPPPARAASSAAPASERHAPPEIAAAQREEAAPPACPPIAVDVPVPPAVPGGAPLPAIEDPHGTLAPFFEKLARRARGEPVTIRIALYGDSNMTQDLVSGELRRVLQARYGDAGHGYVAFGKPWPWYTHRDVRHGIEPRGWVSYAITTHPALDQRYGFAGIAAQCTSRGARAWVETAPEGAPVGTRVSRFDLYYLARPRGGTFEVRVDGADTALVDARADAAHVGFRRFIVPDGPHRLGIVATPGVRLLGVALERAVPGVIVDSLGIGGVNVQVLAREDLASAREALVHRGYDLVMLIMDGTADDRDEHDDALRALVKLHREALPGVPMLLTSPPDFAYGPAMHPSPSRRIARIGKRTRAVALASGAAFWDFQGAMGGQGSIISFVAHHLAEADMVHFNEAGGTLMGDRTTSALLGAFATWSAGHPGAECH